tara:strand:- start:854 stop:982 length:129 start_codon:yes stop_codon:yes gene_type:complete
MSRKLNVFKLYRMIEKSGTNLKLISLFSISIVKDNAIYEMNK